MFERIKENTKEFLREKSQEEKELIKKIESFKKNIRWANRDIESARRWDGDSPEVANLMGTKHLDIDNLERELKILEEELSRMKESKQN